MARTPDAAPPAAPPTDQWVGLEELTDTPAFREMLHREFPEDATAWADPVSRRTFLTLAGASVALAGVGCSPRPASREKIYPYVRQPEQLTLGLPLFFATGYTISGVTVGVLAKSREGRPVKLEGNPTHPTSLGALDPIGQATLLDLYDPDRSRQVMRVTDGRAEPSGWESAVAHIKAEIDKLRTTPNKGVRLLTDTVGSPTLRALIQTFLDATPNARWVQYEPANRDNAREGARLVFGDAPVNTVYDFTKALRVLSLDADFLTCGPGSTRYSRDFSSLRKAHLRDGRVPSEEEMNRLYVVESMLTATGSVADHRLPLRSADVEAFARAVAAGLGVAGVADVQLPPEARAWVAPLVADLKAHGGRSVVVAGDHQPPAVHALAHLMNTALGNVGTTVLHTAAPDAPQPGTQTAALADLVKEMNAGTVGALIIIGTNPVYAAPVDLEFGKAMLAVDANNRPKVGLRVHMGTHLDETGLVCDWHLNQAHYLETWGDGRGHDGTASIHQPLIAPLFNGRSPLELIAALLPLVREQQPAELNPRELVRAYWSANWPGGKGAFSHTAWQKALQDGVVPSPAAAAKAVEPKKDAALPAYQPPAAGLELTFRPDPTVYDGRFANNGWLQELPKPVTKLTWDNALIMSPKTAKEKGINVNIESTGGGEHGRVVADIAEVTVGGRKLEAAVWVQPGHADNAITLHLGYGRERPGKVGHGTGFNALVVRTTAAPWIATGVSLNKTTGTFVLASTQAHFRMEGRRPVRTATLEEYRQNLKEHRDSKGKTALFAKVPKVAAPEWQSIDENVPGSKDEWKGEGAREHKEKHGHTHDHGKEGEKKEEGTDHAHGDPRLIPLTIVPPTNKEGRRWAMAIDLTSCHGCSACLTACMAENNVPVVGKKEVTRGREMHWIRVDRYYEGDPHSGPENIVTHFQPVPCQQCEKAPCEVVCPVAATMHSFDGLNDMVYNRCVGTRYCSNNCPYKVRRFNFLTYSDWKTDTYKLMRNPEVTVRERGVMEKCTYCVQRIRAAEIEAERHPNGPRPIKDGEILTACQQACPAGAIVFGDLNDPAAEVNKWKAQPTNYGLLAELNTMPRTTYLAAVRNPNPAMPQPKGV